MIRVCINSQTPPVRPIPHTKPPGPNEIWRVGVNCLPQEGGVVPMMRAVIKNGLGRWIDRDPRWLAMGSAELPAEFRTDEGYLVETISIAEDRRAAYGRFKEAVWRSFHGPRRLELSIDDYRAFVDYTSRTADRILACVEEVDLVYINDFQQVLVGGLVGSTAPTLLRWHIPLEFRGYPEPVRRFFLEAMQGFDGIVVSTRAALEELISAGFHGRAFQLYPYIDPAEQLTPSEAAIRRFRERFHLGPHPIIFSLARTDPVKRQDLLIAAFAQLHKRHPEVRLVLGGGGSFSTRTLSSTGTTAERWGARLKELVHSHHLDRSVIFTGNLSAEEVRAAYATSLALAHPAPWEGFGLVVVEAWTHGIPVVVSRGAGVGELVVDEVNGFLTAPGSVPQLAHRLEYLVSHPDAARRMGEMGRHTARQCHIDRAAPRLRGIWDRTIELYELSGLRPGNGRRRRV